MGFSNCLRERMQGHTGCICLTFLHYASSNVSSNCLPEKMHNHTSCICLIFSLCTRVTLSLKFFCMELSCSRLCSIANKWKGLSPVADSFKLRKFKLPA